MEKKQLQPLLAELSDKVGFSVHLFRYYPEETGYKKELVIPIQYLTKNPQFLLGGADALNKPVAAQCITTYKLIEFPGCCGMCVSTGITMQPNFVGKGLNAICNEIRQAIARDAGYTYLICTDLNKNERQRKTLARNGWQDIFQFTNKRTTNLLNVSIKEL